MYCGAFALPRFQACFGDSLVSDNPYQAPASPVVKQATDSAFVSDCYSGQKLVLYAVLLYFVLAGVSTLVKTYPAAIFLFFAVAVAFLGLGWTGIYRIGRGLGYSMLTRVLVMLSIPIPFVGLIVLLVINAQATKTLRAAGYSVGLMGARRVQA